MSEGSEETESATRSGLRRGVRVTAVIGSLAVMLAGVALIGRLLAPDPTDDPCAAVASAPIDEFFADDGGASAVRLTLPGSSTQRCVWLPRAADGSNRPAYRRVEITFGLADQDEYLDRMASRADTRVGAGEQARDEGNEQDGADEGDPRTVRIDESTANVGAVRLATVQRTRTEGAKDIVLELSARSGSDGPDGADSAELDELVSALAEDLRPLEESALARSSEAGERMLPERDVRAPVDVLVSEGLGVAESSECARVPSDVLAEVLGEHDRAPAETGSCSWQFAGGEPREPRETGETPGASGASPDPNDAGRVGGVNVVIGTADDQVTALDAYAELASVADPRAAIVVDEQRTDVAAFGAGVRGRVLVGRPVPPEVDLRRPLRTAEVVAIRDRRVVRVHYFGARQLPDGDYANIDPEVAERAALRIARAILTRS